MRSTKKLKADFSEMEKFDEDDVTNSDDEYSDGERELLQKVRKKRAPENFDSDDEVYGLHEDDHDSMESDIERPQEDDDLPDERAWGKKKRSYYMTDYVDPDYATTNEKDMADAELEEKEARNIQQRLAEQLDDADFGLDLLQSEETEEKADDDYEEMIKTDLSKLTKRQKLALMQKESPEFHALVDDFKERMSEAKNILMPFLKLAKTENLPDCPALNFIKTKYQLILNYCVNVTFYLMLKAKKISISNHPVIKRLAQYRQLLGQLEEGQGKLVTQAAELLAAKQSGGVLYKIFDSSELFTKRIEEKSEGKQKADVSEFVEDEEDSEFDDERGMENEDADQEVPPELMVEPNLEDEKRPINYQIAKNKGLTPHRKKEQRNPRVKHRNKYRKAKIRRKGAVREVRKELNRYAGEMSGIKASVKKSIKLK